MRASPALGVLALAALAAAPRIASAEAGPDAGPLSLTVPPGEPPPPWLPAPPAPLPDTPTHRSSSSEPHHLRAWLEACAIFGINAVYYWTHTNMNTEDWEIQWSWDSWDTKLTTLDYVRFDTNPFWVNAITHPVVGLLYYQVGRANGYDMLGATALNASAAVLWEYVAEFKEKMSLNDLIINTAAGFGASEPLLQVGRYFRTQPRTTASWLFAFLFSPFESLHDPVPGHTRGLVPTPWHRFRVWAGEGTTRFDGEDGGPSEGQIGLDMQLMAYDGYGRPGSLSGSTDAGAWSRVQAKVAMGRQEPESWLPGVRIATETTLMGRYAQEIDSRGRGRGLFAGLGTGFLYETRRLERDQDRVLIAHLLGPRLELGFYRGPVALRCSLAAYGDFSMVQAHVFGPDLPFTPDPPFSTPLRRWGYYFAYGATIDTRAVLEGRWWAVDLQLWGHAFGSLDGRDRIERDGGMEDPQGISDQRMYTHVDLTVYPWDGPIGLGAALDGALRRGAWHEQERDSSELNASLQLSARF